MRCNCCLWRWEKKKKIERKGEKETLCKGLLLSTHDGDSIFSTSVALGLQ